MRTVNIDPTEHHKLSRRLNLGEKTIKFFLFLCAAVSVFVTVGIVLVLVDQSLLFFGSEQVSLIEFFTGTTWEPQIGSFGIAPLLLATLLTCFIALALAVPLGVALAIYLSEYASSRAKNVLKPLLDLLSGIPTIVFAYFALSFVTPLLRSIFGIETVEIYNTASAGIVIGLLIIPMLTTLMEDAMSSLPADLKQTALSLGATRIETSLQILLPAAKAGILAAVSLGFSRAIGETMIVAVAAGAGSKLTLNPFEGAETMTGYMIRISGGDISYGTKDYSSLFAIALVLFVITTALNLLGRTILRRFKAVYK